MLFRRRPPLFSWRWSASLYTQAADLLLLTLLAMHGGRSDEALEWYTELRRRTPALPQPDQVGALPTGLSTSRSTQCHSVPPLQFLAGEAGGRWGLVRRAGDGAAGQDVALRPGRHGSASCTRPCLPAGRPRCAPSLGSDFRHPNVYLLENTHHGAACAELGLRLGVPSLVMQVTTLNFVPNCFSMCEI
jgi:hypothetical protein